MTIQSPCQETAGFLFAHRCKLPATAVCSTCGKAICVQHTRIVNGLTSCIGCGRAGGATDPDDPYDYSSTVYTDYHAYDNYDRYSRADREAFEPCAQGEAPSTDTDWESDFDGS